MSVSATVCLINMFRQQWSSMAQINKINQAIIVQFTAGFGLFMGIPND